MQKTKKVVCLLGAVMLAAGMMAFPVCAKEANVAGSRKHGAVRQGR